MGWEGGRNPIIPPVPPQKQTCSSRNRVPQPFAALSRKVGVWGATSFTGRCTTLSSRKGCRGGNPLPPSVTTKRCATLCSETHPPPIAKSFPLTPANALAYSPAKPQHAVEHHRASPQRTPGHPAHPRLRRRRQRPRQRYQRLEDLRQHPRHRRRPAARASTTTTSSVHHRYKSRTFPNRHRSGARSPPSSSLRPNSSFSTSCRHFTQPSIRVHPRPSLTDPQPPTAQSAANSNNHPSKPVPPPAPESAPPPKQTPCAQTAHRSRPQAAPN